MKVTKSVNIGQITEKVNQQLESYVDASTNNLQTVSTSMSINTSCTIRNWNWLSEVLAGYRKICCLIVPQRDNSFHVVPILSSTLLYYKFYFVLQMLQITKFKTDGQFMMNSRSV